MPTPLEIAQSRLDAYLARELAILSAGQETGVAGRRRRDADLLEIRKAIRELQIEVADLSQGSGQGRLHAGVPL